jgi:glutathione S-transferase
MSFAVILYLLRCDHHGGDANHRRNLPMNTSAPSRPPIRLWRHPLSGHCHRVELLLHLLDVPFEAIDIDFVRAEQKSPSFLARNPFGQVPVIEDGDVLLADSNAILVYLARRYDTSGRWLPDDAIAAARVQRWLSVAAGELAGGAAAARVAVLFGRERQAGQIALARRLFGLMEQHLANEAFLAGAAPTLADVAMYAYTAHAPEGGVALDVYPNIEAWLARIEALPGFVGMQRRPAAPALAEAA